MNFPNADPEPPQPFCSLHAYFILPSFVFFDKYQLSSPNFLASMNLHSVRAVSGETDLEAPDWLVSKWGSTVLFELAPPYSSSKSDQAWHATLPLHFRYLPPTADGVHEDDVPWPLVFWACPAEGDTEMSVNPFDRVNLGYEGFFGQRTVFYHLQPQPAEEDVHLMERLKVPVLKFSSMRSVEFETLAAVLIGTMWILWVMMRSLFIAGKQITPRKKTQ